ncbi:MAG: type II CRISPR RNA-guided endonuclease Cas9 [Rhodoferax sp.]|jgi:CRISPR-associated endonuclease Csn1|uniref:type II CRISPR RNA-guided endonuclease Cas9 n=1 Tax=Rhodoferax sp. TaxID=50421 RepID=UPI001B53E0C1|nr:type II CRISPR RNA-guided endonuclease Cas9 [Rhodoferax sp.]MBP8285932.1 type II CRISPR RNA-guided endonuclease Cas9 [Rhodoferax sp.]MBP9150276.1 type II CRISPR RNA-guided endonuclease Cas9 [Rhodoferax sp.]MBP9737619.1 type II CRISPR RNA-guided endonuclease Cas9 [Rhodoferax sp.]
MAVLRYRLALDLGSTSLGWAMIRLNHDNPPAPVAVIKAGVRIFSDGRNPKDGSSLAVTRREARAMRRRRDRLLKRKERMIQTLINHGLFPADEAQRKALVKLNPYALRAKGLDQALTPPEFARALFHITQRRGFKSNRKTDKKDNDSGALKQAISKLRTAMTEENCRTVGEWLHKRDIAGQTVRARYRQTKVTKGDGKTRIDKSYDLYIDRAMIEAEFDALWSKQASLNPMLFNDRARDELRYCLLFQRPLKPVKPGRCTLMPEEERAPLALPSVQRFRIYQEVNNLRILRQGLKEEALTLKQRDDLVTALEVNNKRTFTQIKSLLGLGGAMQFNFEDPKRQELKGNTTSAILSKDTLFGKAWLGFDEAKQNAIVMRLVKDENEAKLMRWLQEETGVDEAHAEAIANIGLPEGYGSLCSQALARILPELRRGVVTYDKAVLAAGFDHHSNISPAATGEILPELPYYGIPLQRHVGFGSGKPEDSDEKRYGKIANPTVHIGLNQVRLVVNALLKRYGHPSEVIVELARDLKQSKEQRDEDNKRQADNQRRNLRLRSDIAIVLNISPERVRAADIQKMILWEELSDNVADRRCPYSGVQISAAMLLSDQVEIEHILPFSETLDDSLNNKTVAMRQANRIKGNRTPWQARNDFEAQGWHYVGMLARAELMPKTKRYRFGEEGYQRWLKDDAGFLARALNDTRYLSKVAREYLSLVCPQNTRVIPGRMTAMLRAKFGLNDVLGLNGEKNRNDHRHHAVDACVIAVTDQGLLQRFAQASASAREQQLNRLVDDMPLPWPSYREHVARAIGNIWVSHKPDHGHEGAMHNNTAYGLLGNGRVTVHKVVDGKRERLEDNLKVIEFSSAKASTRHGLLPTGEPRPYKGYKGDSNYCIEIVRNDKGKWEGEVISTFEAYQLVRQHGLERLRHPKLSFSGKPLVMRISLDDTVRLNVDGTSRTMRVATLSGNGQVFMADIQEANVDARNRDKSDPFTYISKMAGSFQKSKARRITISPIGELHDSGFKK